MCACLLQQVRRSRFYDGMIFNPMDLEAFPFDSDHVVVVWDTNGHFLTHDLSHQGEGKTYFIAETQKGGIDGDFLECKWAGSVLEYELVGVQWSNTNKVAVEDEHRIQCTHAFSFVINRKSAFYVQKVIVPVYVLAAYGALIFDAPFNTTARSGYSMSVIIAMVGMLYVTGQYVPKVDRLTVLDRITLSVLVYLGVAALFSLPLSRLSDDIATQLNQVIALVFTTLFVIYQVYVLRPHTRNICAAFCNCCSIRPSNQKASNHVAWKDIPRTDSHAHDL